MKSIAHTKYEDWKGFVSIDENVDNGLFRLCENHGIDTNRFFVVGFGLSHWNGLGISETDSVHCTVLLVDMDIYGNSFDQIAANTQVEATKKSFWVPYTDIAKAIKRFSLMTLWKIRDLPEIIVTEEK